MPASAGNDYAETRRAARSLSPPRATISGKLAPPCLLLTRVAQQIRRNALPGAQPGRRRGTPAIAHHPSPLRSRHGGRERTDSDGRRRRWWAVSDSRDEFRDDRRGGGWYVEAGRPDCQPARVRGDAADRDRGLRPRDAEGSCAV